MKHLFSNRLVLNRILTATLAVTVCVTLGACASAMPKKSAGTPATFAHTSPDPADLPPYRMQVGDRLTVKFYRNPELDQDVIIRPDGKISLPFVDEVLAAGQTPAQLDDELTARYRGELTVPDITVIVMEYGGQKVYVDGQVNSPGVLELKGNMTLFQAIQEAGGVSKRGHKRYAVLVRTEADGTRRGYRIDYKNVRSGRNPEKDIPLQAYDIVHVPHSGIGNANDAVELYIRGLLPISLSPLF